MKKITIIIIVLFLLTGIDIYGQSNIIPTFNLESDVLGNHMCVLNGSTVETCDEYNCIDSFLMIDTTNPPSFVSAFRQGNYYVEGIERLKERYQVLNGEAYATPSFKNGDILIGDELITDVGGKLCKLSDEVMSYNIVGESLVDLTELSYEAAMSNEVSEIFKVKIYK